MLRLLPSDPLYPAWDWLLTIRAAYVNAGCWHDLAGVEEAERAEIVAMLTVELEQAFEELTHE